MITVFSILDVNLSVVVLRAISKELNGRKVVRDESCVVLLYDPDYLRFAQYSHVKSKLDRAKMIIHVQVIKREDNESIKQAKAIRLSGISNTSTALFRLERSFIDMMKSNINYTSTF